MIWLNLSDVWLKMEQNAAKLKAKSEAKLLQEMEKQAAAWKKADALKRQYLLMENERQIKEQLRQQVWIL